MKNLPNTLIMLAAAAAVLWVIVRLTGITVPIIGAGAKGVFQFVVVLLLFSIALSVKKGE